MFTRVVMLPFLALAIFAATSGWACARLSSDPLLPYAFAMVGVSMLTLLIFDWRRMDDEHRRLRNSQFALQLVCTQEAADAALARLAIEFHQAAEGEGILAARVARGEIDKSAFASPSARSTTLRAKKTFWGAHEAIRELRGIEAKKSHKDYLPPEIRPEKRRGKKKDSVI